MTLRLSAFFESHMKTVMCNYKASMRRAAKNKNSSVSPTKRRIQNSRTNAPRMKKNSRVVCSSDEEDMQSIMSHNLQMDDDDDHDDDDDDDMQHPRSSGLQTSRRNLNSTRGAVASTSGSNRVTSSCSTRRLPSNLDAAVRARRSKRHLNRDIDDHDDVNERLGRVQSTTEAEEEDEEEEVDDDEEEEDTDDSSDSSGATSNDSDEDEEESIEQRKRKRGKQKQFVDDYGAEDSEESYKPNRHMTRRGNNKANKVSKKKKQHKQQRKQRARRYDNEDDEDENDEDYVEQTEKRVNIKKKLNGQRTIVNGVGNSNLQTADEVTQEATNSARKRGRPSKQVSSSNDLDDGPSTSASALRRLRTDTSEVENSPQGRTRRRAATDAVSNAATLENNDHSYHLPVRNGRLIDSDTDSREMLARPTRASVKRAILDWARSSDVEEAEEEIDVGSEAEELQTTATTSKLNGGSRGRPYSVNNHLTNTNGSRQLRRKRNSTNDSNANENDDYAGSDDEPLSQHCSQANQTSRNSTLQRRVSTTHVNTTHMTRSHTAISSTSSTSVTQSITMPHAVHDHNYLGDMGPSTSGSSQRNIHRRVLSRHQRNADELDNNVEALDSTLLMSRMRRMPSSTSNEHGSQEQQPRVRRGRSRYSQDNSQSTEAGDNENVQLDNMSIPSDEGTGGGTVTPNSLASEDDSEDNQPLTAILPSNNNRGKTQENNKKRNTRSRQASDSLHCEEQEDDEEEVNVEDNREEEYGRKKRRKHKQQTNVRQTRLQKRPRYNEQSDEDEDVNAEKRQRYETVTSNTNNHNGISHEDDSDEMTDDSDEQLVSVSSRGRIRKLTAKARGIRNNW